jgi:hypothetical protein
MTAERGQKATQRGAVEQLGFDCGLNAPTSHVLLLQLSSRIPVRLCAVAISTKDLE